MTPGRLSQLTLTEAELVHHWAYFWKSWPLLIFPLGAMTVVTTCYSFILVSTLFRSHSGISALIDSKRAIKSYNSILKTEEVFLTFCIRRNRFRQLLILMPSFPNKLIFFNVHPRETEGINWVSDGANKRKTDTCRSNWSQMAAPWKSLLWHQQAAHWWGMHLSKGETASLWEPLKTLLENWELSKEKQNWEKKIKKTSPVCSYHVPIKSLPPTQIILFFPASHQQIDEGYWFDWQRNKQRDSASLNFNIM